MRILREDVQRRRVVGGLLTCGAAALLFVTGGPAGAQEARAPKGPIEITVGTGAGGTPDIVMRRAAKVLADSGLVTNPIVIQNRTGGSWTVAANYVLGKPGDENLLLGLAGPIFSTPIVQGMRTFYDQFTPIAMFVQGEVVVGVHPESGITSLKQLIAKAAEREKGLKIAGAQVGAVDHMVTGMMEKAGHVKFNFIPFDSGGAAQTAFLGNNSDVIVLSLAEAVPLMKSGKLKVIALLSETRRADADFKDVPTAREQGFDVVWSQNWGLVGPPKLDPAVVKWWDQKLQAMVQTDDWKKMIEENFFRTEYVDSEHVEEWMKNYHEKFLVTLQALGLSKL